MKKTLKIIIIFLSLFITACGNKEIATNLIIDSDVLITTSNGAIEQNAQINKNQDNIQETDNNSNKDLKNNDFKDSQSKVKDKRTSSEVVKTDKNDQEMINVNIMIDCKTILDNKGDIKSGYEEFIPNDGIILDNVSVKIEKGSTVLKVLEKVNKEYDLKLKAQKSPYGAYVKGIKNIEEKICGGTSGWMYSVNSIFPGQSASAYRLKDGDKISWRYTCKPGDLN